MSLYIYADLIYAVAQLFDKFALPSCVNWPIHVWTAAITSIIQSLYWLLVSIMAARPTAIEIIYIVMHFLLTGAKNKPFKLGTLLLCRNDSRLCSIDRARDNIPHSLRDKSGTSIILNS